MNYLKKLGIAVLAATALSAFVTTGIASATTLEVEGKAQNKTVAFSITQKSGTSTVFKDTTGNTVETCSGANLNGDTVSPFTNTTGVNATLLVFEFTGCSSPETKVKKGGKLSFEWTKNTEGLVRSLEAEIQVFDGNFGVPVTCKTGTTVIGTVTGVATGQATLDVNAGLACGALGSLKWEGTYLFTSPNGLGLVN